ncbi:TSUP family transporter [Candidatus Poribacteria bacterium]|nr:TSUP family transporter [Candidatus Poribacteria bacterium]
MPSADLSAEGIPREDGIVINFSVIIFSSFIVIIAFLVRGLAGFGSGLLMVPSLLLLLDIMGFSEVMRLVVPTANILAVLSSILLLFTFRTREWIRKDVLLMMIAGAVVGSILGVYVLASYSSDILKKFMGLFLCFYALRMLFTKKKDKKEISNRWGLLAGFLGGSIGGMFGTGGPPVIIYLSRQIKDKRMFRATLLMYFLVVNAWQCATFCCVRLVNWDVIKFVLFLIPAFILGNIIGSVLHIKINQKLFNIAVASILLLSGIFLVLPDFTTDTVQSDTELEAKANRASGLKWIFERELFVCQIKQNFWPLI